MLASLLPGVREVRGPLVAGYLWLLFAWLVVDVPERAELSGPLAQVAELGDLLTPVGVGVAASFAAYLIGSLSEDLFGGAYRIWLEVRDPEGRLGGPTRPPANELIQSQVAELTNRIDRLGAEANLRVALTPPLIALIVYMGTEDSAAWFIGGLVVPAMAGQAFLRSRQAIAATRVRDSLLG
jgi:hypothetical protein